MIGSARVTYYRHVSIKGYRAQHGEKGRRVRMKRKQSSNYSAEREFSRKLRQEQKSSVNQLFTGGELLAVLPTGFGKSRIFKVLALAKEGGVVIVIKWGWKGYATPTSRL